MISPARIIAIILSLATACSSHRVSQEDEAALCVPADTVALAGLRLEQIRGSSLYPVLPAAWRALIEPLRDATDLMLAYNGNDLLVIAKGHFRSAPAGVTLLSPTLALAGSPAVIRAATVQRATGRTGAPGLLGHAAAVQAKPIWLVVQGRARLPLAGNFANLNRVLRLVDYVILSFDLGSRLDIRAAGVCQTADDARQLEEAARALLTLAAASTRDADLAAPFRSAQVTRDGPGVQLALSASTQTVEKLLR